jgi:hypothetical protein
MDHFQLRWARGYGKQREIVRVAHRYAVTHPDQRVAFVGHGFDRTYADSLTWPSGYQIIDGDKILLVGP